MKILKNTTSIACVVLVNSLVVFNLCNTYLFLENIYYDTVRITLFSLVMIYIIVVCKNDFFSLWKPIMGISKNNGLIFMLISSFIFLLSLSINLYIATASDLNNGAASFINILILLLSYPLILIFIYGYSSGSKNLLFKILNFIPYTLAAIYIKVSKTWGKKKAQVAQKKNSM